MSIHLIPLIKIGNNNFLLPSGNRVTSPYQMVRPLVLQRLGHSRKPVGYDTGPMDTERVLAERERYFDWRSDEGPEVARLRDHLSAPAY